LTTRKSYSIAAPPTYIVNNTSALTLSSCPFASLTRVLLGCDARRRFHVRFADGWWSVTLMVPQMVHLQDVLKLHTFVLGHLGALLFCMFGFDLRFALVAFDLVSDSIWCEGVGVGVGARGGSTWPGGDYLRGGLGWERWANLRTTNKARSHKHTQAQATKPVHRGPPSPIPTAFQQVSGGASAAYFIQPSGSMSARTTLGPAPVSTTARLGVGARHGRSW